MANKGRNGYLRSTKGENYKSSANEDLPSLTLSWYRIGENKNITGFCTTGELFCFLGNSDRRYEHAQLLKIVAGKEEIGTLVRHDSDLVETSTHEQRNKIMGRSRSNTLTSAVNRYTQKNDGSDQHVQYNSIENGDNDHDQLVSNPEDEQQDDSSRSSGIFIDGVPLLSKDNTSRKRLSYLEPNDTNKLSGDLTVLETLEFSSQMRQEVNVHEKQDTSSVRPLAELNVLRLLTDMGFKEWAESKIKDLDKWQRRMVLFASEAVAGKDILLFNYPTMDLDVPSALSLVTSLQRAAKGGRLVALTMTSLTFREYAMLDKIQLLSSNGSIYFGAVSRAMNYFASLKRTPSPGASISDFLLDMVDDDLWPGGYSDAHLAFLETQAQKSAENDFRELTMGSMYGSNVNSMVVSSGHEQSTGSLSYQHEQALPIGPKAQQTSPLGFKVNPKAGASASSLSNARPLPQEIEAVSPFHRTPQGSSTFTSPSGHYRSPLDSATKMSDTTDLETLYDSVINAEWLPSIALDGGGSDDTCSSMLLSSALARQFVLTPLACFSSALERSTAHHE